MSTKKNKQKKTWRKFLKDPMGYVNAEIKVEKEKRRKRRNYKKKSQKE